MKVEIKIIISLLVFFFVNTCQKVYNPEDLDDNQKIPVIYALITNNPPPYLITLYWASSFKQDNYEPIVGARIILSDDKNHVETIIDSLNNGRYYTHSDGITGMVGTTYTLKVEIDDLTYVSEAATMAYPDKISKFNAEISNKKIIGKNFNGEVTVENIDGLDVYADLYNNAIEPKFYRFYTRVLSQYIYYTKSMMPTYFYCPSISALEELPNIKSSVSTDNFYGFKKHKIGFLPYIYNLNTETESLTAKMPAGWIIENQIYSINADVFNYYQIAIGQLKAENRIFDPISTQLKGNMKCITDTTKSILGIFEVASVNKTYTAFYWKKGTDIHKMINLPDYKWPEVDTCVIDIEPDFWIPYRLFFE